MILIKKKYFLYYTYFLLFTNFCIVYSQSDIKLNTTQFFIENKGQLIYEDGKKAKEILYALGSEKISLYLHKKGIIYSLKEYNSFNENNISYNNFRIDFELVNTNDNVIIVGEDEISGFFNFYYPHCPNGITNVNAFKKVTYKNIYDGIDLVFYINKETNGIKYDFIVFPNANPNQIKMKYLGCNSISLNDNGNIEIHTPLGNIEEHKPLVYSISKNKALSNQSTVKAGFSLKNDIISFKIGNYNKKQKLIIDPNVIWSTFYGASGVDHSFAVATDTLSNAIITGNTLSDDIPVTVGAFQTRRAGLLDIHIAKFNPEGRRIWSTYYGGSESDYASDICCDRYCNIMLTGWTWSQLFPTSANSFQPNFAGKETDAFIIKLDPDGKRIWTTFCGGDSSEHSYGINCDVQSRIAITGWTLSSDFPTTINVEQLTKTGSEDAFLVLVDSSCNLLFGTYYGGDSTDISRSVAFDNFGNIGIVGFTKSPNLRVTSDAFQKVHKGEYDTFFSLFDIYGVITFGTYYGGIDHDYAYDLSFDNQANAIFTGYSLSSDFPVSATAYQKYIKGGADVFVVKMNTFGLRHWATFYGGSSEDYAQTLSIDKDNNIAIGGSTYSSNFPVTDGAYQEKLFGLSDAFVFKISSRGTDLLWSSFFGGYNQEWGYGLASEKNNKLYFTGDTESQNFPILNAPEQQRIAGLIDAFLIKLCPTNPNPVITFEGSLNLCIGDSVVLDAGVGFKSYYWSTGQLTRKITVRNPGQYTVTVYDANNCPATSKPVTVFVNPEVKPKITGKLAFCEGDSSTLDAGGGYKEYNWSTGEISQRIRIKTSGKYKVIVTDFSGCKGSDSVAAIVYKNPLPVIKGPNSVCAFSKNVVYHISGVAENSYFWKVSGGSLRYGVDSISIFVNWGSGGNYKISIKEVNDKTGCVGYDTITVVVSNELLPKITSNTGKFYFCDGDSLTLDAGEGYSYYYWSNGDRTRFTKLKSSAFLTVTVKDDYGCEGKDTVTVLKLPNPSPVISGAKINCKEESEIYQTQYYQNHIYNWRVNRGRILTENGTNSIEILFDSVGLASIDVEEIDTSTGCRGSAKTYFVEVKPLPYCKISYIGKLEFCNGDSVVLDAGPGFQKYLWNTGSQEQVIIAKESGVYQVQVTDEFGCETQDSIMVVVHQNPEKPIISEKKDTLISTDAFSYLWFKDGIPIEGANKKQYIAKESGNYSVTIQNQYGCYSISDVFYAWRGSADAKVVMPDTIFIRTGKIFTLSLDMVESHNLNRKKVFTYDAYIRYNTSSLLPIGDFKVHNSGFNEKTIIVSGERTDTICLLNSLDFYVALGNEECSTIYLDSLVWREDFVSTTINNTVVCLTNLCKADGPRLFKPTNTIRLSCLPNPAHSSVEINYELIENGFTSLKIYNIMGKEVVDIYQGMLKSGMYNYIFYTELLPTGTYICILKTPSHIISKRLDIIK